MSLFDWIFPVVAFSVTLFLCWLFRWTKEDQKGWECLVKEAFPEKGGRVSKFRDRYVEHCEVGSSRRTRVLVSREKVCNCGGTLDSLSDEECFRCQTAAMISQGEMVVPRVYGTTHLMLGPDISHITRPIMNKCKHCGTKSPCSANRCSSCGAPL
jgi:hypothetical protein